MDSVQLGNSYGEQSGCPPGFKEEDGDCQDINECLVGGHDCLQVLSVAPCLHRTDSTVA